MENIPNHLFDLLHTKDFQELTATEQTNVLAFIDEQTYTSMRMASVFSQQFFVDEDPVTVNPVRLQQLLTKVEAKQFAQPNFVWNKPIALWKVAALFLLLGGGWTVFVLANKNQEIHTTYITQLDTVFVDKVVPGEKIHDTVYIEYERKQQRKQHRHNEQVHTEYSSIPAQEVNIPTTTDMNIVGIKKKDEPVNDKKGNSIKDDSLINAFGFVTL